MSDQLVAETTTWQHTTLTVDRHPSPSEIRNHNLNRRAAADRRLRPRSHREQLLKHGTEGKMEGTERQGRICKQLLDDLKENKRYCNLKRVVPDSHFVENPLWKRLWTCCKTILSDDYSPTNHVTNIAQKRNHVYFVVFFLYNQIQS
jgi:hypothetical protein